ncbi:MAG: hypothetical protein HRU23_14030 [Gammaproteobacteria bacterium]|nr:hypothetical protein [Gammaproteobacteria bacterium]
MKIKILFFLSCILAFTSTSSFAGNPGQNAMNCLSASTNSKSYDNLVFKNTCSSRIFVVWCGDLKHSKKECGDGPKDTYYTHSANIAAYSKKTKTLKRGGSYSYAACKGRISFGSKGIKHPANKRGRFTCTRT